MMDVNQWRLDEYLTGVDDMFDDDEGIWTVTDIECPFCGHLLEWKFTELRCDNCELTWPDRAAVDRDRREPHDEMGAWRDEPTDEYMFNRALRWGTK